jgi:RNA polymerase sigma factor (sigma-70 family)
MTPDQELLRRYVDEKSDAAFAELVQRYVDLVYSAAVRQVGGDAHRAQDVAQVVFTTLARKAGVLTNHPVLTGWLYTTTHFAAEKTMRSEWRRLAREREAHAMQEISAGAAESSVDWERIRPVLDAAMRELGERDREAVLLRFFAGRPFAEIGTTLHLSEDAARMRVQRALDQLHALLARRGVTSTAAALAVALSSRAVAAAPAGLAGHLTSTALAGSAAAPGLVAFMTTTKFTALVAAALALAAVGTAIREVRASHVAAASLDAMRSNVDAQRSRVHGLEQQATAADQEGTTLARAVADAREAKAAEAQRAAQVVAGVAAAGAASRDPVAEGTAYLAAHPTVRQALLARSRARVASRFQPMYAKLGLSPDQVDKFETLMIEYEGISTGNERASLVLRAGTGMGRDEVEAGVRALLGDDGYRAYRDTANYAGAQTFATELAGSLYFTDAPLTAAQSKAMTDLLVEMQGNHSGPTDRVGQWDAFVMRAESVLSPPQIEALQAMHAEEEVQRTLAAGAKQWAADAMKAAQKPGK